MKCRIGLFILFQRNSKKFTIYFPYLYSSSMHMYDHFLKEIIGLWVSSKFKQKLLKSKEKYEYWIRICFTYLKNLILRMLIRLSLNFLASYYQIDLGILYLALLQLFVIDKMGLWSMCVWKSNALLKPTYLCCKVYEELKIDLL